MPENKGLPQRKLLRMKGYDYSTAAHYFITMVLQNRENLLGRVIDEQMVLNAAGEMVEKELLQLPNKHPECTIEHHVVMPNHIHFIITLYGNLSLSEIIREYKSLTTHLYIVGVKQLGWLRFEKKFWQHNYFEHIIRNNRAFESIAQYIMNNPARWEMDDINPNHGSQCDDIITQVLKE